jgi:peptidase E
MCIEKANRVADALASIGCQITDVSLYDNPPNEIDQLCSFDSSGVATPRTICM